MNAREDALDAGDPAGTAALDPQLGRSAWYADGSKKSLEVIVAERTQLARTAKAGQFAKALQEGGISAQDAASMDAAAWKKVAEGIGSTWTKADHAATVGETLFELRKLEAATTNPAEAAFNARRAAAGK
jgi:hypothetical protein